MILQIYSFMAIRILVYQKTAKFCRVLSNISLQRNVLMSSSSKHLSYMYCLLFSFIKCFKTICVDIICFFSLHFYFHLFLLQCLWQIKNVKFFHVIYFRLFMCFRFSNNACLQTLNTSFLHCNFSYLSCLAFQCLWIFLKLGRLKVICYRHLGASETKWK